MYVYGTAQLDLSPVSSQDHLSINSVLVTLKFIYSEKATKFCEIFTLLLTGTTQCARTDLNKRFLPKPMTTTG